MNCGFVLDRWFARKCDFRHSSSSSSSSKDRGFW